MSFGRKYVKSFFSLPKMLCGLMLWSLGSVVVGCGDVPPDVFLPKTPTPSKPNPTTPTPPAIEIKWDQKQAAVALEQPSKQWFENPSARRSDGKTACLSCHTTFTYVIARTIFRKRFKLQPTALEEQLFKDIALRVSQGGEAPAWYQSSPDKISQSHGSEAVLNAMALATRDAVEGNTAASDITIQALDVMWKRQRKEGEATGSWAWLDFGLGPWENKGAQYWGAAMAAIAVGTAPGYLSLQTLPSTYPNSQERAKNIDLLRAYLMKPYTQGTLSLYDQLMLLWASTKLPGLLDTTQRQSVVDSLLKAQQSDGGWSLLQLLSQENTGQTASSDASATAQVLYVLYQQGMLPTEEAMRKGFQWLGEHQTPEGHWTAPSINGARRGQTTAFMSDAATAYALMALSLP